MDFKFMIEALNESDIAFRNSEVPIGAVVVYNGEIIGRGHNQKISLNDPTAHAEVMAIREACKNIGDWRLSDCDLYVTLKPCEMCINVSRETRIRNVYFLVERYAYKKQYKRTYVRCINNDNTEVYVEKYASQLSDFFKLNCNR